jgi:hypothetical protein
VKKVWDDEDNRYGKRPERLNVTLKRGEETVETVTLSEENGWTATVKGQPKYAHGQEIRYTWTEDALPEGYSLTNTDVNGTAVSLEIVTDYPFKNTAKVVLNSSEAVTFPLELRIPCWTVDATISYKGATISPVAGKYYTLDVTVDGETQIDLTFPMVAKVLSRPNSLYAIERGPLVYSLKIGEDWRQVHQDVPGREFPHCDWEIYATTPWNYAFLLRDCKPELISENFKVELKSKEGQYPWNLENAPVSIKAKAVYLNNWQEYTGSTGPIAYYNEVGGDTGEEVWIELIPYGCTTLRIAEFPTRR